MRWCSASGGNRNAAPVCSREAKKVSATGSVVVGPVLRFGCRNRAAGIGGLRTFIGQQRASDKCIDFGPSRSPHRQLDTSRAMVAPVRANRGGE